MCPCQYEDLRGISVSFCLCAASMTDCLNSCSRSRIQVLSRSGGLNRIPYLSGHVDNGRHNDCPTKAPSRSNQRTLQQSPSLCLATAPRVPGLAPQILDSARALNIPVYRPPHAPSLYSSRVFAPQQTDCITAFSHIVASPECTPSSEA